MPPKSAAVVDLAPPILDPFDPKKPTLPLAQDFASWSMTKFFSKITTCSKMLISWKIWTC